MVTVCDYASTTSHSCPILVLVNTKLRRKILQITKKSIRDKRIITASLLCLLCVSAIGYAIYMDNKRLSVDPTSYTSLLQLIARAESNDNYNAYFGSPNNSTIKFTEMTISDVLAWQADFVQQGNASSAVGRYQIIDTTLSELVQQLGIDTKHKFDQDMQDRLAIALLERRGAEEYINKELKREEFATNLAMEWAALPKVTGANPTASYYDGDGLNQARVGILDILRAIDPIRAK